MSFPLYVALKDSVVDQDLTDAQKLYIINSIPKLDIYQKSNMYALIKCSATNITGIIPFNGKSVKGGLKFNLEDFPFILRQILYKYINSELSNVGDKDDEEKEKIKEMIEKSIKK